jgi:hypothetical protein
LRKAIKGFKRLPSPALIISIIALVAAVGGGYAVAKGSDKKSDKKIAKKVSNKQITKRAPGLSVAHAKTADSATEVSYTKHFSTTGGAETVTTLAENDQWRVVGLCDPAGTLTVPGFDNGYNTRNGTAIGIVDKSEANAFGDTDDDDDSDFNPGEGIAFNYQDFGDGGGAVAPDGHAVFVPGGANIVVDSTDGAPGFTGTSCRFAGLANFL